MLRETKPITINYIYFYHLQKCCIIPVYPETIADGMNVSFSQSQALGRTAPVYSYSQSGPRTFNITLNLHRDLMMDLDFSELGSVKDNVVPFWNDDYIDTLTNYIQASAYPVYKVYKNGSKAVIPPRVAIRFGDDVFLKGIINGSVSVQYGYPILTYDDGTKHYAKITLSFPLVETDPYDAEVIKQIGSFRGATAAFKEGIFRSKYETFDDADLSADSNLTSMTDGTSNNTNKKKITGINWENHPELKKRQKETKIYWLYIYPWMEDYAMKYGNDNGYWLGSLGTGIITAAKNHENVLEKYPNAYIMSDSVASNYLGWYKPSEFKVTGVDIMISTDWYAYVFNEDHWILNDAYNRCLAGNSKSTPNDDEYSPKKSKQLNIINTSNEFSEIYYSGAPGAGNYTSRSIGRGGWSFEIERSVGRGGGSFDNERSVGRGGGSFDSIYYFIYVYHWIEDYAADPESENHGKFESYWLGLSNFSAVPQNGTQLTAVTFNEAVKLSTNDASQYLSWNEPDKSYLSEQQITTEDMWYVYIPDWDHMIIVSEYKRCLTGAVKTMPKYSKYTHPSKGGTSSQISSNYN